MVRVHYSKGIAKRTMLSRRRAWAFDVGEALGHSDIAAEARAKTRMSV